MMNRGHAQSELIDNRRIWTLTVDTMPAPYTMIEWDEPACGLIPARTGVRGWISADESTVPGTQILIIAPEDNRCVRIQVGDNQS